MIDKLISATLVVEEEFKSLFSFFFAYMNPDNIVMVCVETSIIVSLCQDKVEKRINDKAFFIFARDGIHVADMPLFVNIIRI